MGAALKAYGLLEDIGRGQERRVQLTDLAWRILHDTRAGARESAVKEAALRPRLFNEYAANWLPERPSDKHCISELHLDRGFTLAAAEQFLRAFDETMAFANLRDSNNLSSSLPEETREPMIHQASAELRGSSAVAAVPSAPMAISFLGDRLEVRAVLQTQESVAKLITALQATIALLPKEEAN